MKSIISLFVQAFWLGVLLLTLLSPIFVCMLPVIPYEIEGNDNGWIMAIMLITVPIGLVLAQRLWTPKNHGVMYEIMKKIEDAEPN